MGQDVIFSDLPSIAREKERISRKRTVKTWEAIPFETAMTKGVMLGAFVESFPKPVSLKLNLNGWYQVYIALLCTGEESYAYARLSSQPNWTAARYNRKAAPPLWSPVEFAQEVLLFAADLTGQDLQIARPVCAKGNISAVMWVRCVPIENENIEAHRTEFLEEKNCNMHVHLDGDISCEDAPRTVEEFCMRIRALEHSDAEVISQEISFDFSKKFTPQDARKELVVNAIDKHWNKEDALYFQKRVSIAKKRISLAHKMGKKIYAANRMQVSDFGFPYHRLGWNMEFYEENPQFRAVWRDGQVLDFCSYAYPEVREYISDQLIEHLKLGYDGLTLFWHRGMYIGFDKPVIEWFRQKYPEINPCLLPMDDQKLYEVWEEFLIEFMRILHKKVQALEIEQNRSISIHVIGGYSVREDMKLGINFVRWAEEGLIQEISQADMETKELLEGCMSDTNTGIIDLERYYKKARTQKIIYRTHGTDLEREINGMPGYLDIEKNTGVKVYHVLPWVHSCRPEEYAMAAKELYKRGAKRLLMWNTLQCIPDLAEWNTVKRLGHKEKIEQLCEKQYYQYVKVLSIGGMDIRYFNPCWRG